MEHHDDQPPNHTTDSADKYGKEGDRDIVLKKQIRQEQEYQAKDGVNGQPHHQRGCSCDQGKHRDHCYDNHYEHDPFHGEPLYLNTVCADGESAADASIHQLPRETVWKIAEGFSTTHP